MTKTVGVDSSTAKTGMSLFVDGVYREHCLIDKSKIHDVEERIDEMGKSIIKQLDVWKPDLLFIESPRGHGNNLGLVEKLATVIGIVRGWCLQNNVYIRTVLPSVWRKHIGIQQGKKRRDELKAESVSYVKRTYNIDCTDDEADAICIGGAIIKRDGELS